VHPQEIPEIGIGDVTPDTALVDVREDDEWQAGHAEHARHIPLRALPTRLAEVPTGSRVAVICRSGGRSAQATAWLRAQGYDAVNVAGGMVEWEAAGRPMVSDTGQPPVVI
jgi:rhodanese-related sulfurtransferase